jgi:hypothetical protein
VPDLELLESDLAVGVTIETAERPASARGRKARLLSRFGAASAQLVELLLADRTASIQIEHLEGNRALQRHGGGIALRHGDPAPHHHHQCGNAEKPVGLPHHRTPFLQ